MEDLQRALIYQYEIKCMIVLQYYDYLIGRFNVWCRGMFLRVTLYFGEPVGRVKIQETSKNIPRYYTLNRPIRDLLFNSRSIK